MNIQSVVIHEIVKQEHTLEAELFLTNDSLDVTNEGVIKIINSLNASFSKKSVCRAKFSNEGFSTEIEDFNDFNLIQKSRILTGKLKDQVMLIQAAKGGYLIFCRYTSANKNYLAVFLVRNINAPTLNRLEDNTWDVNSTIYLDVAHFAMGVRIDLNALASVDDIRYIQLVRGNTEIADYFESWVGINNEKKEIEDGNALFEITSNIELPDNINREALRKQIFDYANGRPSRLVNLRELSEYLYQDENIIPTYCEENDIDIDGEFNLNGKQLHKFAKISITADNIKLEAQRSRFNQDEISVVGDTVIIRSAAFAEEILKHTPT